MDGGLLEKGLNGINKTPDPLGGRLKRTDLVWVSPNYNHSSYNHMEKWPKSTNFLSTDWNTFTKEVGVGLVLLENPTSKGYSG